MISNILDKDIWHVIIIMNIQNILNEMNNKEPDTIYDEFIDRVGFLGTLFGFPRVLGQLYGVLFLSPDPMTLDGMSEALHISKSNVCMNIRELIKWGFVKKIWVKGERKDFYVPETDMKSVFNTRLHDAVNRRMNLLGELLDEVEKGIMSSEGMKKDKQTKNTPLDRIKHVKSTHKKMKMIIKGLELMKL
ncbi:GbsR/MarR family transcriptional regulator [Chlamydiota bacterium]